MGTSATVRLIEGVRLIRCPLNTGFTVLAVLKNNKIDLVTVFDAILTSRQTCEKLQCLYENLMSNNFHTTAVLKKNINLFNLCFSPLFQLEKRGRIGNLAKFPKLRDFSTKMEIPLFTSLRSKRFRAVSRVPKTENLVPRSFFAPKQHGNACYAGYLFTT